MKLTSNHSGQIRNHFIANEEKKHILVYFHLSVIVIALFTVWLLYKVFVDIPRKQKEYDQRHGVRDNQESMPIFYQDMSAKNAESNDDSY